MMKRILYFFILILFNLNIFCQENSARKSFTAESPYNTKQETYEVPKELYDKCNDFFNGIIEKKISESYNQLLKNSPIASMDEKVQKLIFETKRANKLYGEMKSYQPVNYEFATDSFLRLRYLALHSDFPMRWVFTFYKSPDRGWIVINLKLDDLSEYFFSDE